MRHGRIDAALMSSLNGDSISSSKFLIARVIVSLEPFYLLLNIHNLLVDEVILNFREPLAEIERVVI